MLSLISSPIPYCGSPPDPASLWQRWNLDPILIGFLLAALAIYLAGARRRAGAGRPIETWRQGVFGAGWLIGSLALISPLCPLSVSLFGARVGQHMILSLIAAPLVMLGRPGLALKHLWPKTAMRLASSRAVNAMRGPVGATLLFAIAMWFWHAPGPYDATFASPLVYWTMHLTIFGSALLVWNLLLDPEPGRAAAVLGVGAASTLQMTFLGALITLTPRLLYAPHVITPYAWGMTQASDQQMGGLIMWVPGCTVFLVATIVSLGRLMSERTPSNALSPVS